MATYHLELRHFPRQSLRFNQSGAQIGALVLPWVEDRVIEIDGEKWAPYDSEITIIEGPEIPVERLSMGRGWPTAQREGTDVTDRVLSEARAAIADGSAYAQREPAGSPGPAAPEAVAPATATEAVEAPTDYPSHTADATVSEEVAAEPVTAEAVEALLGEDAQRLLAAWRGVSARTGGLAPSESLALAERELQRGQRDGA
jgi:hypothetical protein